MIRLKSICLAGVLLAGIVSGAEGENPLTALAISDPDQFSWTVFTQVVSPVQGGTAVTFQTWASNTDTFSLTPTFPTGAKRSVLAPLSIGLPTTTAQMVDFPDDVQEVRRNRPAFDFITGANGGVPLVTQADLRAVYNQNVPQAVPIVFPDDAIEVKAVWWPMAWIAAAMGDPSTYYRATDANGNEIALVGLHVFTKAVPDWTWATFEHESVPGRCDFMNCTDSFGAIVPVVEATDTRGGTYGPCLKTPALMALFKTAGLSDVWQHYCLKGSQVSFTDATGRPTLLGNSIIESRVLQTSSCISCHARATIDANGQNVFGFGGLSAVECNGLPTCSPNGAPRPQWFYRSVGSAVKQLAFPTDFAWSIPFCALPDTPAPKKKGC